MIRQAVEADAQSISRVLIRSITQLCFDDHKDAPEAIASWTAEKSPEDIVRWINAGTQLRVSECDGQIAAVGGFLTTGRILLLYVHPAFRGAGHSSALLDAMEQEIASFGNQQAQLVSSHTALGFYRKRGWHSDGPEVACYSTQGQPMKKQLIP
ncbi:GNAT family N-acetyltransferase [Cognatishimia sp. WU-CL00825]|uniref:GNAT family N-acetyltransferase n=1 Tax=Cognatishimia sp. WU-CL00825 TaxID=3127658 RepID=UPI00310309EC